MLKTFGMAAAAVTLLGALGVGAQAMPIAPADGLGAAPAVTLVADGCGPGGHRSHYGYCKSNGWGGGPGWRGPGWRGPGWGGPGYGPRRCWIRETPYGPRRVCR